MQYQTLQNKRYWTFQTAVHNIVHHTLHGKTSRPVRFLTRHEVYDFAVHAVHYSTRQTVLDITKQTCMALEDKYFMTLVIRQNIRCSVTFSTVPYKNTHYLTLQDIVYYRTSHRVHNITRHNTLQKRHRMYDITIRSTLQ